MFFVFPIAYWFAPINFHLTVELIDQYWKHKTFNTQACNRHFQERDNFMRLYWPTSLMFCWQYCLNLLMHQKWAFEMPLTLSSPNVLNPQDSSKMPSMHCPTFLRWHHCDSFARKFYLVVQSYGIGGYEVAKKRNRENTLTCSFCFANREWKNFNEFCINGWIIKTIW